MIDEKSIEHLWNAAGSLTPLNHTKKLLKSYYLTISRKIARYNFILPKEKFGDAEMCEKCSSCWFDGNFSIKLISAKIRNSKAKRLVEDLESGENLTKKQKNRAKWYRKKIFSFLQFNCKLCGHKTNVRLLKPHKDDKSNKIPEVVIPIQKQKIKKKKKDKLAGLKIDSILNKSKSHNTKTEMESNEFLNTECDDIQTTSKIVPRTPTNTPQRKQLKKIESRSLNIKKSKNKKNTTTKTHVVSKTQQQNTILQLAQMLKQSGNNSISQNPNNKSDNRLKNLLR